MCFLGLFTKVEISWIYGSRDFVISSGKLVRGLGPLRSKDFPNTLLLSTLLGLDGNLSTSP